MSALKKKITDHTPSQLQQENLLGFIINKTKMNPQKWRIIKTQLAKTKVRVVKNQIATSVIKKRSVRSNKTDLILAAQDCLPFQKLTTLFQGPLFMIGMSAPQECEIFFNIIKKQRKLVFVGGLYQGQLISHLDLPSILKGERQVFANLIRVFQSSLYTCAITDCLTLFLSLLKSYSFQDLRHLKPT